MRGFNLKILVSRISSIIPLVVVMGCTKDNPLPSTIHPDFLPYVNRFVAEAKARNVDVKVDNLTIQYVDNIGNDKIGNTIYGQSILGGLPNVQIVQSLFQGLNDSYREILIFHELGHAILGRQHLDTEFPNGLWLSMMHSNSLYLYTKNQPELRAYHLYELFHEGIQVPDKLIAPKPNSAIIFNDTLSVSSSWTFTKSSTSTQIGTINRNNYTSYHSSLSIQASGSAGSGYWYASFSPPTIPVGSGLVLKVKIKLDQVTSGSAWISMQVFTKTKDVGFYKSTYGSYTITGTQDFVEYTLSGPYYPDGANSIFIYMGMTNNSTGTVYFDDVSLTSKTQ